MQTAIQVLQDKYEAMELQMLKKPKLTVKDKTSLEAIRYILCDLQSLLPAEQEIIEDAVKYGRCKIEVGAEDEYLYKDGADYYLATFKSKDNGE